MSIESLPIPEVSALTRNRWIYAATAPFRGYGMERIPGLRALYGALYALASPNTLHELNLPTMRLLVDLSDTSIVPSLRLMKSYEATYSRAIDSLLTPGQTVVDVGAHVGYHTVRFAKAVGPGGRVHAYEPESLLSRVLDLNLARNEVSNWTDLHRLAVSAKASDGKLWRNGPNTGSASLSEACVEEVTGAELVEIVSLDDHLLHRIDGDEKIDLIKIDVQGFESFVLQGAALVIENFHPTIAFEYNPAQLTAAKSDPAAMLRQLVDSDYQLFLANEYDHSVRRSGASTIHSWCMDEKPDGSGGFVNVLAIHAGRLDALPWTF